MELIKRNIHMDRVKRSTVMQFTMEEDLNLPEDKPDISTLNLEKGEVVIEEICPGTDEVTVRGKLGYAILYHTRESGSSLVLLGGALPFEERIRMEGVLPSDTVTVEGTVEDFTVNMINSRKLSLQALILLSARIEEIYDEELPVGIQGCLLYTSPSVSKKSMMKSFPWGFREKIRKPAWNIGSRRWK